MTRYSLSPSLPISLGRLILLVLVALVYFVSLLSTPSSLLLVVLAEPADTGPDTGPIKFVALGQFDSDAEIGKALLATADGGKLAVAAQNRRGGIGGRKLEYVILNSHDSYANIPARFEELKTAIKKDNGTVVYISVSGRGHLDHSRRFIKENGWFILNPVTGDRKEFLPESYSTSVGIMLPSPNAEMAALVKHMVVGLQLKRIGIMTDMSYTYGNDMIPYLKELLSEFGLQLVVHYQVKNKQRYDADEIERVLAARPQGLLMYGAIYEYVGYALGYLLFHAKARGDTIYVGSPSIAALLISNVIKNLNGQAITFAPGTFFGTMLAPLPTDTSFQFVRQYREEIVDTVNITYNLEEATRNEVIGTFSTMAYAFGASVINHLLSVPVVNRTVMTDTLFDSRFLYATDFIVGPYTKPCVGQRRQYCECNCGARDVLLGGFVTDVKLVPIPSSRLVIPPLSCAGLDITIQSPQIQLMPLLFYGTTWPDSSARDDSGSPNRHLNGVLNDTLALFVAGNKLLKRRSGDRSVVYVSWVYNDSDALPSLVEAQSEKLLTVTTGAVFAEAVESLPHNVSVEGTGRYPYIANVTPLVDPVYVMPTRVSEFRYNVLYVLPTFNQELHGFASFAASQRPGGSSGAITLMIVNASERDAVRAMLTDSLHTFRQEDVGGSEAVASIAEGMRGLSAGGVYLVHGVNSAEDVTAMRDALERLPDLHLLLPMAHVRLWYAALVAAMGNTTAAGRLWYATSLPRWGQRPTPAEAASAPALAQFFDKFPEGSPERSPRALEGYYIAMFIQSITDRIPQQLTDASFLRMVYDVSTVPIDGDLRAGPFFGSPCTSSGGDGQCETNVGAQTLSVRPLASDLDPAFGNESVFTQRVAGHVVYRPLPEEGGFPKVYIAVIIVGAAVLLLATIVLVVLCCCGGRSHKTAPKDTSRPFTIIFTDIQSSTSLWAEVPDVMAEALDMHHSLIRSLIKKHRGYEVKTIGDAFMVAFKRASDAVDLSFALQEQFFSAPFSPLIDRAYLNFDREKLDEAGVAPEGSGGDFSASVAILSPKKHTDDLRHLSCHLTPEEYEERWSGLRVRIGIHTGHGDIKKDPVSGSYDYYGTVVNTAARVEACGHGGQVLVTASTYSELLGECGVDSMPLGLEYTSIGMVELRGLPAPIELLQVTTVPGRTFPPLRLEKANNAEDLDAEDNTAAASDGASRVQTHIPNNDYPPVVKLLFSHFLRTTVSVMPLPKRKNHLKHLCDAWRVKIRKRRPQLSNSLNRRNDSLSAQGSTLSPTSKSPRSFSKSTPQNAPQHDDPLAEYVDTLAMKLAPIAYKKNKGLFDFSAGGGGMMPTNLGVSLRAANQQDMVEMISSQGANTFATTFGTEFSGKFQPPPNSDPLIKNFCSVNSKTPGSLNNHLGLGLGTSATSRASGRAAVAHLSVPAVTSGACIPFNGGDVMLHNNNNIDSSPKSDERSTSELFGELPSPAVPRSPRVDNPI